MLAKADPDMGPVDFVMPVTVYLPPRAKMVAISLPEDKLAELDEFAQACGMKRSRLIAEAVAEYIARRQLGGGAVKSGSLPRAARRARMSSTRA